MFEQTTIPDTLVPLLLQAADRVAKAEALLITAGAGMGVDSGLPDFRGDQGFWNHYPALGQRNLSFVDIAQPQHFFSEPALAWGFYGHRLLMYRQAAPHDGFRLLREWGNACRHGAFVYTSNVDGQFQKAGFSADQIAERHGSIHHLQCSAACHHRIWDASEVQPIVDTTRCQLRSPPPRCPECGNVARPNILMFNDLGWLESRTEQQMLQFERWLERVPDPLLIEIGAGTAISTIRHFGRQHTGKLIRINPGDPALADDSMIQLPLGALAALSAIDTLLRAA